MSNNERALDHAWGYFQLHANQRVTVFNYFVVFSGLLVTGMVAAGQTSPRFAFVGVVLGLLLCGLSYIFFRLDQRVSFLIKNSEDVIKKLEPSTAALFSDEVKLTSDAKGQGLWTYGQAFRTMFFVMAVVGLLGAGFFGIRGFTGHPSSETLVDQEVVDSE